MPRGGFRLGAGRPSGSRSPYPVTRELSRRIKAVLDAAPKRDLEVVLADIAQDKTVSVDVRLASLRRLQGYLKASWLLQLESEGVRLPRYAERSAL